MKKCSRMNLLLFFLIIMSFHEISIAKDNKQNSSIYVSGINVKSSPSIVSCPIGSCPPLNSHQLSYSLIQQYGITTRDKNWEFGAIFGLLDTTGGRSGQLNDQTNGAKIGAYIGLLQTKTGGPGWALNTNIIRNSIAGGPNSHPGYAGSGVEDKSSNMNVYASTIGYELDVSNFDRDANGLPPQYPFVVGEYLTTTSTYPSWAGLFYGIGHGQKADAWHNGILFSSPNIGGGRTVSDNTILDLSNSDTGYHSQGKHAISGWYDESSGKYGIWLTGNKYMEDINITSNTPVGIAINGNRPRNSNAIHLNILSPHNQFNSGILDTGSHGRGQSYDDQSTGAVSINAEGTYSSSAFSTQQAHTRIALSIAPYQKICFNNSNNCIEWDTKNLIYSSNNKRLFSIDNDGNISIRGIIKQNVLP